MPEIMARPLVIESPRVTAGDVRWESYEELADFLASHAEPGADPEIFQNERGEWVRWWSVDDPDTRRFDPATGELVSRRYDVQRRVALTQEEARRSENRWDFVLPAEQGKTLYGRPYVWMHEGVKPETDPGLYYARDHEQPAFKPATRERWITTPAAEAAAFLEREQKLRQSTGMTQVIREAAAEVQSPPARGGKAT